jgi:hypothetical protein
MRAFRTFLGHSDMMAYLAVMVLSHIPALPSGELELLQIALSPQP